MSTPPLTTIPSAVGSSALPATRSPRGRRPLVAWIGWVVVAGLVGLGGFAAGRATFVPPVSDAAPDSPVTVTVVEATVGRAIPMNVVATWGRSDLATGAAEGTLTELRVADGDLVGVGTVLYTVDLRPVFSAVGEIPAFRDLSAGLRGEDVAQLQRFLKQEGYLAATATADGSFGATTTAAVRAWQRRSGLPVDGVVRASDLLFARELPARVAVNPAVSVGDRIGAGDSVLTVLATVPSFTATLPQGVQPPTPDEQLEVFFGGVAVPAVIQRTSTDASGAVVLDLTRADGGPVCGDACADVPLDPAAAYYAGRRVVVPETTGLTLPAAAIGTAPDGGTYVELEDGRRVAVTVVARGDGRMVVEGLEPGTQVVLRGTQQ